MLGFLRIGSSRNIYGRKYFIYLFVFFFFVVLDSIQLKGDPFSL